MLCWGKYIAPFDFVEIENIFADKGDLEHDADCKCLDYGWGQAALQHPCSGTRHTAFK
jgi:hypothetical protein